VAPTFDQATPANTIASCDSIPTAAVLTATDTCGSATVTMTQTTTPGSCPSNYTIVRTWIATDACGNASAPVSQSITVSDTTGPVLVTNIQLALNVTCDQVPPAQELEFTDNCSTMGAIAFTQVQSPAINGAYSIVRTWTVADACGNTTTITQKISVTQLNTVINLPDVQTSNNINENLSLNGLLPAGVTGGTWTNVNNVGGFNQTNGTFNPFEIAPANYLFSYTINDGGCLVTYNVLFIVGQVNPCESIVIHNAFTPNGDGINEYFSIEHLEDTLCYPTNKVEIYNRWGILVYETKNYDNSSRKFVGVSEGRVTVSKSDELPTGTYFYIIEYTTPEGQTVNKDGYLYLTR
jgi:gliding motility-associated-like protein